MSGINWKGFTPVPTFVGVSATSDKDGIYKLSQIVPKDTNELSTIPISTTKVPLEVGFGGYQHNIFLNGHYTRLGAPYDVPRSEWGETITLNYQFIKI